MSEVLKISANDKQEPAGEPESEPQPQHESPSWLNRIRNAWQEIAGSMSGGVRPDLSSQSDIRNLREQMQSCLDALGGEVSARARAASLGETYLGLDSGGRERFLQLMANSFELNEQTVADAIRAYQTADDESRPMAEILLREALEPKRVRLLTQFNALRQGVKFLVDMRADLLKIYRKDSHLTAFERDFRQLLASWFDIGFLELERISWDHPASLLEKLIAYEAVHRIRGWDDLRNRLESDRRCFAFFHPRMPDEPLIFVQVALVNGLSDNVHALLDKNAPITESETADTAIFYSISNAQTGLGGISFGGFLIKRVVDLLKLEFPSLKTFATLSPVPGLRRWLKESLTSGEFGLEETEIKSLKSIVEMDTPSADIERLLDSANWYRDEKVNEVLQPILKRAAAEYLACAKRKGGIRARDPVANFHLTNGARIERLNWLADTSRNGLKQSAGMMVNYLYDLEKIEANHEAYSVDGETVVSPSVKRLLKG
jgi:malonyl-CoA decarboxylase